MFPAVIRPGEADSYLVCLLIQNGSGNGTGGGVSPALGELLARHAMRTWGEDLPPQVRGRLEQGG